MSNTNVWTTSKLFEMYHEMRTVSADIASGVHLTSNRVSVITEQNVDIQKQLVNVKENQNHSNVQLSSIQGQLSTLQNEMTTLIKRLNRPETTSIVSATPGHPRIFTKYR